MMQAGKFWIGDLCYVLGDRWGDICDLTITNKESLDGEFELPDGTKFAIYQTFWGDGEYGDRFGNKYPVDSGTLGCVLLEDINDVAYFDLGHVHQFESDFQTGVTDDGLIYFGEVDIATNPKEDDDIDDPNSWWYIPEDEKELDYVD